MKFILLYLFSALILAANGLNHHKIKIIEKIFSEISINKELIIWSDNEQLLKEVQGDDNYKTSSNCIDANILIIEKKENIPNECKNKYIFVLNYKLLSDVPQSFGALFWKKGRPNIVIIEPRIKTQLIKVSKNLDPYLEEKVW